MDLDRDPIVGSDDADQPILLDDDDDGFDAHGGCRPSEGDAMWELGVNPLELVADHQSSMCSRPKIS
jgi:hypothetical protein